MMGLEPRYGKSKQIEMGGFKNFERGMMNKPEALFEMRHEGKGRINDGS